MQVQGMSDPKVEIRPDPGNSSNLFVTKKGFGSFLFGPFIDWFPDAEGGGHLGLMLGIGALGLDSEVTPNPNTGLPEGNGKATTGIGGSIWGGYDFWVADQWSLGGALRLTGISAERKLYYVDDGKGRDSLGSIQILFTGLYH